VLTALCYFTATDGEVAQPSGLVQGSDGSFYGTTFHGFTNELGTVFKISATGALTTLHSFTGGLDGESPAAGLVLGNDGNLYGTASGGGNGHWSVFRLSNLQSPPVFQSATISNNTLGLTWSTEAGASYQLQCNSNLNTTNWTNLGSPVTATGATLTATDSRTNGPQRFYRTVLLP
jgi:uncharacterized repeat protein (TIGR03803 family)